MTSLVDRLTAAKFSKSGVWDKVPDGSTLLTTQCGIDRSKRLMPNTSSICPAVSIQYRLVTDRQADRRTDGRTHDDNNYRASIASRGVNDYNYYTTVPV